MVEIIYRIVKFTAALSLQVLSFSLLFWGFKLYPNFTLKNIALFLGVCVLVYLFVSYSLSLFKQTFERKQRHNNTAALDEDEILRNKKHD